MDWQIYEENWQPEVNRFMEAICLLICRRINFGAIYHGATVSVLAPVGKRRSAGCVAVQVCICFSLLMVRRAVPNAGRESPYISCLRVSQFFDSSAESYPLIIDAPKKSTRSTSVGMLPDGASKKRGCRRHCKRHKVLLSWRC